MVDSSRLIMPGFGDRLAAVLAAGVDIYAYGVSAQRLRTVIREGPGNDNLKEQLISFLETEVIRDSEVVSCLVLGMAVAEFAEHTNDEDILCIADEIRDLNKLPFVIENGRRTAK